MGESNVHDQQHTRSSQSHTYAVTPSTTHEQRTTATVRPAGPLVRPLNDRSPSRSSSPPIISPSRSKSTSPSISAQAQVSSSAYVRT